MLTPFLITRKFNFNSNISTNLNVNNKSLYLKNFLLFYFLFLNSPQSQAKKLPYLFLHKKSKPLLTLVKSPMAQKKFSKEQFTFLSRSFFLVHSFKPTLKYSVWGITTVIFFIKYLLKIDSYFSTNLIYLSTSEVFLPFAVNLY